MKTRYNNIVGEGFTLGLMGIAAIWTASGVAATACQAGKSALSKDAYSAVCKFADMEPK